MQRATNTVERATETPMSALCQVFGLSFNRKIVLAGPKRLFLPFVLQAYAPLRITFFEPASHSLLTIECSRSCCRLPRRAKAGDLWQPEAIPRFLELTMVAVRLVQQSNRAQGRPDSPTRQLKTPCAVALDEPGHLLLSPPAT